MLSNFCVHKLLEIDQIVNCERLAAEKEIARLCQRLTQCNRISIEIDGCPTLVDEGICVKDCRDSIRCARVQTGLPFIVVLPLGLADHAWSLSLSLSLSPLVESGRQEKPDGMGP